MLRLENVEVYYGVIKALKGITLEVREGEIVSLIGANGAGKTTTLRTISGLLFPKNGNIYYNNEDITNMPPYERVGIGIAHSPEGREIFTGLTVYENLILGAYLRNNRTEIDKDMKWIFSLFPRLYERLNKPAGTLSGGEQQMLAIGRALMAKPKLLMLDEPSLGLAPILVEELFEIIENINKEGMTILLVEQNANMALSISHRAYVLETGTIKLEGIAKELQENEEVKKAYLGA